MAVTITTTNAGHLHSYFSKKLLKTLQPRLQLMKLGKKESIPEATGDTAKWAIYTKIASSTSALTEGTNPSEISFTVSQVTAQVAQYGQYVKVSDLLESTAIDKTKGLMPLFAKAGEETIEDLIVAELNSTLTVQRVNDAANDNALTAADVVSLKEFLRGAITLEEAYVGEHEGLKAYAAVVHPANKYDLLSESNDVSWLNINQYADPKKLMKGEFGSLYNMRFMVSDKMSAADNASSVSVKNNFIIGEECFGTVSLGGRGDRGVEVIVKPADSGGQSNPLNMFGTIGYKIKAFKAKNFAAARGILLKGASAKG